MNDSNARLEHALEQLGAEHEPPLGWETRVLTAIKSRREHRWWWLVIPAVALVLVLVIAPRGGSPPPSSPLALAVVRIPGPQPVRGDIRAGDGIRASVRGGADHRALWVYRGETELVAVCPGGRGCRSVDGALTLELTLDRIGSYRIVALTAAAALPAPRGAYDADLAAAMAADATIRRELLDVQ